MCLLKKGSSEAYFQGEVGGWGLLCSNAFLACFLFLPAVARNCGLYVNGGTTNFAKLHQVRIIFVSAEELVKTQVTRPTAVGEIYFESWFQRIVDV